MKTPRQDTERTRKKLLAAANEIFSTKGYHNSTIAEISERAGVNIAAINYHFGDKETLYREAWRYSYREFSKEYPSDFLTNTKIPAEERLRIFALNLLRRVTDESNKGYLIVYMELANPTGLLEEVSREELRPIRRELDRLVREIMGPMAPDTQVQFSSMSIMSLCTMPLFFNRIGPHTVDNEGMSWGPGNIEAYAEHVIAFSLGGMKVLSGKAGGKDTKKTKSINAMGNVY